MATDVLYDLVLQKYALLNVMLDELLLACSTEDKTDRGVRVQRITEYTNHRGIHKTPMELESLFLSGRKYDC